jgi:hypothetical protein
MLTKVKERAKPVTYLQIRTALQAYELMYGSGMPDNIAIRSLRDAINVYASEVFNGKEVPVSIAARGLPKSELKLEHETSRTELARIFIRASRDGILNEDYTRGLMLKYWRIAHITNEEDKRLTALGLRSELTEIAGSRWAKADIRF